MLGDVADERDQDHTDKELGDAYLLDQRLYGPHKGLRDVGDGDGRRYEQGERRRFTERW